MSPLTLPVVPAGNVICVVTVEARPSPLRIKADPDTLVQTLATATSPVKVTREDGKWAYLFPGHVCVIQPEPSA